MQIQSVSFQECNAHFSQVFQRVLDIALLTPYS